MRRPQELIDRQQFLQPVPAVLQNPRVAGKAAGIAGAVDDPRHLRLRKLGRLRHGAGARRIEHGGIEGVEFRGHQRIAEQVAMHRRQFPAAETSACCFDRRDRGFVAFIERRPPRTAGRQGSHSCKQVRHAFRLAEPHRHRVTHRLFGATRRLQEGARGRLQRHVAKGETRRAARDQRLRRRAIAPAQAGEIGALGECHELLVGLQRQSEPLVRPHQHIEAGIGVVHDRVGRSTLGQDAGQHRAQRRQYGDQLRRDDEALLDIDHLLAGALVEARKRLPALPAHDEVRPAALVRQAGERGFE